MQLIGLAVIFVLSLILVPFAVEAQPAVKVPRIGLLMGGSSGPDARVDAFRQGFRELGYIEGKTIAIEWRFAEGRRSPR